MLSALLDSGADSIVILSRDEEKQDALRSKLRDDRVEYRIGDVRDRSSIDSAMKGVCHVFHAAALKQVPSCEFFPMEAVRTNVEGSANVIHSAISHGVRSVVCLSTDKAVFPINAMGMSKALMEKIAQSAARELGPDCKTVISCVRYGNVMYSRGSVIPLFVTQIREQQPITITVPDMTRFLMPLRDSVSLVKYAFENARSGDLFIRKASAATMMDLLSAVKNVMGVPDHPVTIIGWRHGEKLFETLASSQELSTAEDLGDYWRLQTDLRGLNYKQYFSEGDERVSNFKDFDSHNATRMSVPEIEDLLLSLPEIQAELENN
jgi:UDP-glucose 4-epimerase